jgi:hypothetical protein
MGQICGQGGYAGQCEKKGDRLEHRAIVLGRSILRDMKTSCVLSFVCGAAVMFSFSALSGSNSSHHIYELRLYRYSALN